jgi:hypothetical protein
MICSIFSEEMKKDDLAKYQKHVLEVIWFKISNKNGRSMGCNTVIKLCITLP